MGPRDEEYSYFQFFYQNEWIDWKTNIFGKHNIENLISCLIYALNEGISEAQLICFIES